LVVGFAVKSVFYKQKLPTATLLVIVLVPETAGSETLVAATG
jgi:hypothetical protein